MTIDPSRIVVRPSIEADADFVVALSEICMRGYVEAIGEIWDTGLPRAKFVPGRYGIIQQDGAPIGCMDVVGEGDHIRLNTLYLLPEAQGYGVGTMLLRDLIAQAELSGKKLRLRVIRINPARRLYERLGFSVTEEIPGRYYMERPCGGRI